MIAIYRPPTVEEAVAWLMRFPKNLAYRRACLAHWQEKYGDALTEPVRQRFIAEWDKKK